MSDTPKPYNYDLWQHMHDQHKLTLLESELSEIEDHSERVKKLQSAINDFAEDYWFVKAWHDAPKIKALFDLANREDTPRESVGVIESSTEG